MADSIFSLSASLREAVMSVSMKPGAMALTRISGANSNYLLEENAEKELVEINEEYLKSHEILRKVIQGYENEIVSDRQRYKSKYEAK